MSLHVLPKCIACWLVSVGVLNNCVTHVAQNTCHYDNNMQDFINNINHLSDCGLNDGDFIVNIDET